MSSVEGILDLTEVANECDIVVDLESNLWFDKDIATICAKANRTAGIIKHKFSRISTDMVRILFE